MNLWTAIAQDIGDTTGTAFKIESHQALGGGCINSAYRVTDGTRDFFVKINGADGLDMFDAEAAGLREMAATGTVRVPAPVCHGVAGDTAYLVLEYLDLRGGNRAGMERLGEQLAALHAIPQDYFGWHRDNTIGSTAQPNGRSHDWPVFWAEQRLGYQLALAGQHGYGGSLQKKGERLLAELPALFDGYRPYPSLLHGDLWSGNAAVSASGEPVIFDPATYYGDREADLAMTELFGGFDETFYAAYRAALPLDPGYATRRTLYNLYHILNHLNLFGGGYGFQAERMIGTLLSEVG